MQGNVFGTYLHGLFDTGNADRGAGGSGSAAGRASTPPTRTLIPMEEYRRQQFDILADGVRGALDMDAVYAAMGMERR